MIVILSQNEEDLIEVVEITLDRVDRSQLLVWPGSKVVARYASAERAKEVLGDIRAAISMGQRTYELPEA